MLRLSVLVAALASMVPGSAAAKNKKPRIMLLDIPPDPAFSANVTQAMNDFLAGAITDQGFEVITARDIGAVLGVERQKQLLGCNESDCLAELGGAMGADYIVHGNVAVLDTDSALNLSLIDSKGKPLQLERQLVSGRSSSMLIKALEQMVPKLMGPIKPTDPGAATLTATPATTSSTPAGGLTASSGGGAESGGSHLASYVLWGVGAVGLLGAGACAAFSAGDYSDYQSNFKAGPSNLGTDKSNANTWAAIGWTALGVGMVGAVVGTVLYFNSGSAAPAAGATP